MPVLVLDLDGVVVCGHPEGAVQEKFFRPHFQKIAIGEADLLETLERCKASAREFVDYWFRVMTPVSPRSRRRSSRRPRTHFLRRRQRSRRGRTRTCAAPRRRVGSGS